MSSAHEERAGGRAWLARNGAGLLVALGAAAATAHGLYEVAQASKVPAGIAWLYPLITDGLGAVAYSATARLQGKAAGYAWSCVVLAAGLSGLAQAVYLAADTVAADPVLRFGVGAWPAVACALVAHLLHLTLTTDQHTDQRARRDIDEDLDVAEPTTALPVAASTTNIGADMEGDVPVTANDDETDRGGDDQGGGDAGAEGGDARVRLLRELLAAGADVTGPQAAALLTHRARAVVSDRTARRLLAVARDASSDDGSDSQQSTRRACLVLLPTGTSTTSTTNTTSDTDRGDPR